jgi:hypothetical protein
MASDLGDQAGRLDEFSYLAGAGTRPTGTTPRSWPPTLDKLDDIGPLPDDITVHLDAGHDSQKTRDGLATRGKTGEIAHKGDKAPIQAWRRWHVERTNAWHINFNKLQRCYERREQVIGAFFDLADTIITLRSLIRQSWTLYLWDGRPAERP